MNSVQKMGGISLFALWFGAAVSLAEISAGGLIAPLGMKNGILLILLGHLIGCLILAFVGLIGFRENKPALLSSRISLGIYGSYILSILNVVQLTGWTAVMLFFCSKALQPITSELIGLDSFAVLTVITGILVGVWVILTDKGINFINVVAAALLGILSIVMLVLAVTQGETKPITETISGGLAFELSLVMPLSWLPLISDYTKSAKSWKISFWGSFLGYFIGSSLMYTIGLVTAIYTGNSDPIAMLLDINLGFAALLIVVLATITTTYLDVFSSVLSSLNIMPKLSKKAMIIVFTVTGTLLALTFSMDTYEGFLYMIGSIFAPVFAVILIDYFILKNDLSNELINISGIIAAAAGTAFYYLIQTYDLPIGSTIPSMAAAASIYLCFTAVKRVVYKDKETAIYQK